jgi:NAD(P)-dependent dehydrogenase (short-subunit alcohol dehydrogenase family)
MIFSKQSSLIDTGEQMQKIVIFGATGGIGSAAARRLNAKGYTLHLVGRDETKLGALASELGASMTLGDVTDQGLFERVAEDAGDAISGLLYAVGTLNLKRINRLSIEDFNKDYQINAIGAALAVQSLLSALKNNSSPSSVVFFTSVAAEQGFSSHASMSMAKGAVRGLTLALAAELAPKVRVNAISPSLTTTPLAENLLSNEKMVEAISKLHAMERLGTAEDMAALSAFLLSNESGWITGQIIGVDGGRSTLRTKS